MSRLLRVCVTLLQAIKITEDLRVGQHSATLVTHPTVAVHTSPHSSLRKHCIVADVSSVVL